MTESKLKALKNLVASNKLKSESDSNISSCTIDDCCQCCSTTMDDM